MNGSSPDSWRESVSAAPNKHTVDNCVVDARFPLFWGKSGYADDQHWTRDICITPSQGGELQKPFVITDGAKTSMWLVLSPCGGKGSLRWSSRFARGSSDDTSRTCAHVPISRHASDHPGGRVILEGREYEGHGADPAGLSATTMMQPSWRTDIDCST